MPFKTAVVPLSAIDLTNTSYQITTHVDFQGISRSIAQLGLIHPPLIKPAGCPSPNDRSQPSYIVIYGFRRLEACRQLGWNRVTVHIADETVSELTCVQLAIADNSTQRPLNVIEISRALNQLFSFFPNPRDLIAAASALNLPDNMGLIRKLKQLCRLPQTLQEGLLSGVLSLPIALTLAKMDKDVGSILAEMFASLQLSLNKQREILTLLDEIASRENLSLKSVLGDTHLTGIIDAPELDRTQKTARLRHYLRQRRFPQLTAAENAFSNYARDLRKEGIQILPPPHFESDVIVLKMSFKTKADLQRHYRSLQEILDHPSLEKILQRSVV